MDVTEVADVVDVVVQTYRYYSSRSYEPLPRGFLSALFRARP